jgi:hypothetical protein
MIYPGFPESSAEATYLVLQFIGLEGKLRSLKLQPSLVNVSFVVSRILRCLARPASAASYVIGNSVRHLGSLRLLGGGIRKRCIDRTKALSFQINLG